MLKNPFKQYRLRKDLPRQFFPRAGMAPIPKVGDVCRYFTKLDVYIFPDYPANIIYLKRRVVEAWSEYFEPVKERDVN